jgi:3-deoxy-manno-octulosonate cytidylyltransferase (CMP-KDO synthetase)
LTTIAIIPARYGSTRFPGKPLADLCGKPLIARVVERAREARRVDDVIVATDDERILRAVQAHGGRAVMTSPDCASGSDRIAEVAAKLPQAALIVNVQGDEPLMPPEVIDRAIAALESDPECAVSTAMIRITNEADYLSPHVVKVVCDREGRALYFSRSPLPNLTRATEEEKQAYGAQFGGGASDKSDRSDRSDGSDVSDRSDTPAAPFWGFKHFGLYVYRREALLRFVSMPPAALERIEKLEQLRFLENGMRIRVVETTLDSIGVDTPEDLERARRIMSRAGKNSRL